MKVVDCIYNKTEQKFSSKIEQICSVFYLAFLDIINPSFFLKECDINGYNGYNNAVYLIYEICSTLYTTEKGTANFPSFCTKKFSA